jgi:hypothetical protein
MCTIFTEDGCSGEDFYGKLVRPTIASLQRLIQANAHANCITSRMLSVAVSLVGLNWQAVTDAPCEMVFFPMPCRGVLVVLL